MYFVKSLTLGLRKLTTSRDVQQRGVSRGFPRCGSYGYLRQHCKHMFYVRAGLNDIFQVFASYKLYHGLVDRKLVFTAIPLVILYCEILANLGTC